MQGKALVVQEQRQEVDVVAINTHTSFSIKFIFIFFVLLFQSIFINASVLPEERVDTLYHNYTGGGVTIDGPSVLIRKNFIDKISVSANYYVDNITSASIDAV